MTLYEDRLRRAVDDGLPYVTIKLQPNTGYDPVAPLAAIAERIGWRVEAIWNSGTGETNILLRHEAP